jgi:hypothetical protein
VADGRRGDDGVFTGVATPVLLLLTAAVFDDANDLTKRDPFTAPVPGFWESRWPLALLGALLLVTLAAWTGFARSRTRRG